MIEELKQEKKSVILKPKDLKELSHVELPYIWSSTWKKIKKILE